MMKEDEEIMWVIKSTGERERFSLKKLRRSLLRSGADEETIETVVAHLIPEIKNGMTTSAIYKHAFAVLKKNRFPVAVRYSLRKAVMALGPTGFAFEKYIAEILRHKGYEARTGVILSGFCVSHEVDVLMKKDDRHIFVECKYHNTQGIKTDVKVALYIYARFLDLKKRHETNKESAPMIHEGWLVTNTKLTNDAIAYAQCAGLNAIGWDYPEKGNLQDLILETGVHPLTFLATLTASEKMELLEQGVVTCRSIEENPAVLKSLGFSEEKIKKVIEEASRVCHI